MSDDISHQLAEIALALADESAVEEVCRALEDGRLRIDSAAPIRSSIARGRPVVEQSLRLLQYVWEIVGVDITGLVIALLLKTSIATAAKVREWSTNTQVVWTGPKIDGSYLRATREVIREIIRTARTELLVVGYWIAARGDQDIIEEIIFSLADAKHRGLRVTIVIDERIRADGRDNRGILMSLWPSNIDPPRLLTWHLPSNDEHLKLHAKVIVGDRHDALITSANLTSYALGRNMEMGVRVIGSPASDIAQHFDHLVHDGVIRPFDELNLR